MLTRTKYSGKIPLVVGAAVVAAVLMVLLPLAGCDTNSGSGRNTTTQQAGTGTSGTGGNTGAGGTSTGGTSTGGGTTGSGTGDNVGTGPSQPATYTVTFTANGGSEVASQTVESGKTASKPADPELEGSWFLGWYGDSGLAKEYDFAAPVTADTTVYAKWSYRLHATPTKLTDYTSPNHTDGSWTYVAFGDWPQTVVAPGVTVDDTKSKTMGGLTYCLGSDGNHYVKQEEEAYTDSYTYSDGSAVGQGGTTTKWFKVEPVVWRVLTSDYSSTGKALLLAESVLTGGISYYESASNRIIGGQTVYPNNYQYSTVRAWLNGSYEAADTQAKTYDGKGFLQSAFTAAAQALISATSVDNSAASTTDATGVLTQATDYACANTTDKVFLLSEKEATTTEYGFAAYNQWGPGNTRIRMATDYAKATGAYQDSTAGNGGWWWLRSPVFNIVANARYVDYEGFADYSDIIVNDSSGGVVPALCVQLQ